MKNIVFMINVVHDQRSRNQNYEWSVKSWKDWCEKNNAELFVLSDLLFELEYMAPQWYKIFIPDILEANGIEFDKVLYVDSDTIVHPNSPDFFQVSNTAFCAVKNFGTVDWVLRSLENYSKLVFDGYSFPWYEYFNSGVFLFQKAHVKMFKELQDFYHANRDKLVHVQTEYGVGKDQPVLNFFVQKSKDIELKLLPYEYNMQDMPRFEVIGPDMLHTKFGWIYHFNCGVKPTPGYWMEQTYKYLHDNIA
mgnify:FL=1